MRLAGFLHGAPIIPAVRSAEHLSLAQAAPSRIIYLLTGNVATIAEMVGSLRSHDKVPVVNLDLLGGFSGDASAVTYLAGCGVAGVISTHPEVLKACRARDLMAIQRSFMLDSLALNNSVRALERFVPDAVEVLPAPVAPRVLPQLRTPHPSLLVIAGGLITTMKEIDELVGAGIDAVSVSDPRLWLL